MMQKVPTMETLRSSVVAHGHGLLGVSSGSLEYGMTGTQGESGRYQTGQHK